MRLKQQSNPFIRHCDLILKSFKIDLEEEELEAVIRYVKNSSAEGLLSSYDDAVIFGILHQIIEHEKNDF